MFVQIIALDERNFILSYRDFKPNKDINTQIADYIAIKLSEDEVKKIEIRKY